MGKERHVNALRWVVAIVVVVLFAYFAYFLVDHADTTNQREWERWVYVYGGIEAIAFAAIGWMFGREVNRERAENAEQRADVAGEREKAERETGAKLAGLVVGGGGQGRERLQAQGEAGAAGGSAVDFAKRHYNL